LKELAVFFLPFHFSKSHVEKKYIGIKKEGDSVSEPYVIKVNTPWNLRISKAHFIVILFPNVL
jgi:hypothetical protein